MDGRTEGALELILAVFRLAVADYLGRSYSHDGAVPARAGPMRYRLDAEIFLRSPWASYLADLIQVPREAIWGEVRRQLGKPIEIAA